MGTAPREMLVSNVVYRLKKEFYWKAVMCDLKDEMTCVISHHGNTKLQCGK